jgi:hypothetical protein
MAIEEICKREVVTVTKETTINDGCPAHAQTPCWRSDCDKGGEWATQTNLMTCEQKKEIKTRK